MEMSLLSLPGVDLAYHRTGRGAPLVLLHGYPLDHRIWIECLPFLAQDFDLILPDLRGFGQSTALVSQYSMTDMADDLAGLLDHLGLENAFFAGHSMGGYVALAFAKKYPQRVRGLGLVSSQAAADSPEGRERRYKTAAEIGERGVIVAVDAMTEKLSADPAVRETVRGLILEQKPQALMSALGAMAERAETLSSLASVDFPLVLIHGDADLLIPLDRAREILNLQPFATLMELPGAGHMPMMEFPQQTADGLRQLKN